MSVSRMALAVLIGNLVTLAIVGVFWLFFVVAPREDMARHNSLEQLMAENDQLDRELNELKARHR